MWIMIGGNQMKKNLKKFLAMLLILALAVATVGCTTPTTHNNSQDSTTIDNAIGDNDDADATEDSKSEDLTNEATKEELTNEDVTEPDVEDDNGNGEDVSTEENDNDTDVTEATKKDEDSTTKPVTKPTEAPTTKPASKPTEAPTTKPASKPTEAPTTKPASKPTEAPTTKPTQAPTEAPTTKPTQAPTTAPSPWQPSGSNTYSELASLSNVSDADVANARAILSSIISNSMSDVDKIKAVHDYLVKNTTYDYGYYSKSDYHDHLENILVEHRAVCQGYAVAFYVFMKELGIPCSILTGVANNGGGMEKHAWNAVKLDGSWYFVDVTWDDPMMQDTGHNTYLDGSNLSYEYALCTYQYISATHVSDDQVGDTPTPYGTSTQYNDYMYQSLGYDGVYRVSSLDKVVEVASAVTGSCVHMFLVEGGAITTNDVWTTYTSKLDVNKIGGYSVSSTMSDGVIKITVTAS